MVENEKLQNFLKVLDESLQHLESKKNLSLKEYTQNWEIQSIVEREFHKAIQACIDITTRIIIIKNFPHPDDYVSSIDILRENNVFPFEFGEKMKDLVRFRNILVHEYFRIEPEKVYQHLQTNLTTLRQFAKYIIDFLEKK